MYNFVLRKYWINQLRFILFEGGVVVNGYGMIIVDDMMSRAVSSVNGYGVVIVNNFKILVGLLVLVVTLLLWRGVAWIDWINKNGIVVAVLRLVYLNSIEGII